MRCSHCGTENAPDSRFCGGCGARMQTSKLVAPTQKISDDAPYPTSGPSSIPPQNYAPSSIPPQNNYVAPASIPPQNNYSGPTSMPTPAPGSIAPPSYAPASIPPQNNGVGYATGPASVPPQNNRLATQPPAPVATPPQGSPSMSRRSGGAPAVSRQRTPAVSDPSLDSIAPPRRRWGLIITVLLIDLALAGAGVYLLTEGLA